MKSRFARLLVLVLVLVLVLGFSFYHQRERLPFQGPRDLGAGVSVTRAGPLLVVRVPRRSGVRLRAVLADRARQRLLPLEEIARGALAAVNGDYHWLDGAKFARTYSPLVTDGELAWSALACDPYESFTLDPEHTPRIGPIGERAWQAIGTGPRLLATGEVTARVRDETSLAGWTSSVPRTAVGFDDQTIFLVASAQEAHGGLSLRALAGRMKELGCQEALNLDGGPSTALVANGELLNVPPGDEGFVNPVASALLVLPPDGSPGVR